MSPYRMNTYVPTRVSTLSLFSKISSVAVLLVWPIICALVVAYGIACTPGEKQAAKTAFDVAETTCMILNQALPDTEIAKICGIADPFFKPMQDVLSSSRKMSAQASSNGCSKDAGAAGAH